MLTGRLPWPALALLIGFLLAPPARAGAQEPALVYVVRHAERAPGSDDPPLSDAGRVRAQTLARLLAGAKLAGVFSTDRARSRETALPVAERQGLPLELYDADEAAALVARLRSSAGSYLLVGHSNTVPQLVRLLGGDPGEPIADTEYDRLYVVVLVPGREKGASALLRFGEPYQPPAGRAGRRAPSASSGRPR